MRLLLFSNSTNTGESYLHYTIPYIKDFLGQDYYKVVFIPYAAVTISYNDYTAMVKKSFSGLPIDITGIHECDDVEECIENSNLIITGGGNTFHLLRELYAHNLIEILKRKVPEGTSYIGWSAGSNIVCPSIKTTNDMPVVEPPRFEALNLVSFQINPHYTEERIPNHGGETREIRLLEFIKANPDIYVVGLREGTLLKIEDNSIRLLGDKPCKIFKTGIVQKEYHSSDDLQFLL
jgi:dipeptidase E